ncbi:hypothetical protein [Planktothrix mougeotii]|uniref:Uncharacterized protein n=1 Tax=Planktothrix mougeotii LEGE 06226 TaxID=1828728 RepID=A0ABR9UE62_9CYAN|nr:hypothetical protein [Planktothrix mougeotii]MBE9144750.1 hypothetical protein [Planktothrix mougeotii LEGE 06226]
MNTLLIHVLMIKQFLNGMANSYAMISLGYVVSVFLILFVFFGVAASQSNRVSAHSIHSSSQSF